MANLNKAPSMGETEDDDSSESPDIQPIFLSAAFEADKRAKEQALQEENQRRILEFLNFGSEGDDDDEEDASSSKDSGSKTEPVATQTVPDFSQEWQPNQVEVAANPDPDSKTEIFEQVAMEEESSGPEAPPQAEAGMNTPPPPPEEPPTANHDSFDVPPPTPDQEPQFEQPPQEPTEQNPEPRQEVIVERHKGGVGAALLAFFAANWLSRRRDRKLRREAQKLEKDFQKSQEESEAERRYLRQAERKSEAIRDEHKAKLSRLERAQQAEAPKAEITDNRPEPKEGPVPLAEVLAETSYAKAKEELAPTDKISVEERIIKEKSESDRAEKQYEMPTVEAGRESVREDAHEAKKDTKTNPITNVVEKGSASGMSDQSALDAAEASLSRRSEDQDNFYRVSADDSTAVEQDHLYQKSIVTGVAVGVALVVLVAAVYLLF